MCATPITNSVRANHRGTADKYAAQPLSTGRPADRRPCNLDFAPRAAFFASLWCRTGSRRSAFVESCGRRHSLHLSWPTRRHGDRAATHVNPGSVTKYAAFCAFSICVSNENAASEHASYVSPTSDIATFVPDGAARAGGCSQLNSPPV